MKSAALILLSIFLISGMAPYVSATQAFQPELSRDDWVPTPWDLWNKLVEIYDKIVEIYNSVTSLPSKIKNAATSVVNTIKNTITSLPSKIYDFFTQNVKDAISAFGSWLSDTIGGFGTWMHDLVVNTAASWGVAAPVVGAAIAIVSGIAAFYIIKVILYVI